MTQDDPDWQRWRDASRAPLARIRGLIDAVDDASLILLAGRRQLVALAAVLKRRHELPVRDAGRELEVRRRAIRLGERLGLPPVSSDRLMTALIDDACRQQGLPEAGSVVPLPDLDQCNPSGGERMLSRVMTPDSAYPPKLSWLRLLPPPARVAPLLRRVPAAWQARLFEDAMDRVLSVPIAESLLDPLESRRLGIDVSDLGLSWVICLREGRMRVCAPDEIAEATVRGTATDLLLLASRREDADTLFFQRRLTLIGDTELGLTARNLLDQLPWQRVPLALRIAMHRGAGLASRARAAYRGEPGGKD
jgi:predicted lipid carrier protein YhbT/chorismate mutase